MPGSGGGGGGGGGLRGSNDTEDPSETSTTEARLTGSQQRSKDGFAASLQTEARCSTQRAVRYDRTILLLGPFRRGFCVKRGAAE